MARPLTWPDVRGGLIALVVLAVGAIAILRFSRVGALHGDSFHAYALVGEARGVTPGSEVWLSGQKVGRISRVEFRPPSTDTSRRILVEMQLLSRYGDAMHRDATAQIRSGGSFIGADVMYLTPGTAGTRPLAEGDTLRTTPQSDVELAAGRASVAMQDVPIILANVGQLVTEIQATRGSIGALMHGPALGQLVETRLRTTRVMNRVSGRGTVGRVMEGGLQARASRVMSEADSVRALLSSSRTSLGRFRRDSTLLGNVDDIQARLADIQRELDEPRGTAGRVLHDSAVTNGVANARQEMTRLFADLKQHPLRYLSF